MKLGIVQCAHLGGVILRVGRRGVQLHFFTNPLTVMIFNYMPALHQQRFLENQCQTWAASCRTIANSLGPGMVLETRISFPSSQQPYEVSLLDPIFPSANPEPRLQVPVIY